MRYLFVISGPVGVGKSSFCGEFVNRFEATRLSTRKILLDRAVPNERRALQEAGEALDAETGGKWVADGAYPHVQGLAAEGILLIDSARIPQQIEHLRQLYGQRVVHVHLTASIDVLRERYKNRPQKVEEFDTYDELRKSPTEAHVEQLGAIADVRIITDRCDPRSLLALAVAGRGLYPAEPERLVDVVVGGQ